MVVDEWGGGVIMDGDGVIIEEVVCGRYLGLIWEC